MSIFSQYNAYSPYSYYGLGDINTSGFTQNSSMGGLAIGLREPNQINYQNPAALSSQDTMSFIWDIGLMTKFSNTSDQKSSVNNQSTNFDHVAISFPVTRNYYTSVGILPYSTKGYTIGYNKVIPNVDSIYYLYTGSGNLNQVYFGNSVSFLNKKLSVGVNFSYIFGTLGFNNSYKSISDSGTNTITDQKDIIKGLNLNFGFQSNIDINSSWKIISGVVFSPQTYLKSNFSNVITRVYINEVSDTLYPLKKEKTSTYKIPYKVGIGATLLYKNKLIFGFDFTTQDWTNAVFNSNISETNLKKDIHLSFGCQFTPNKESFRSYFERIRYRAGAYYNDGYIFVKGNSIKDYGFSFGLGMPLHNNKSMINIGSEFGRRGSKDLVQIDYSRITFSLILYDTWFYKRKYD
jgi:hypothetical protein